MNTLVTRKKDAIYADMLCRNITEKDSVLRSVDFAGYGIDNEEVGS